MTLTNNKHKIVMLSQTLYTISQRMLKSTLKSLILSKSKMGMNKNKYLSWLNKFLSTWIETTINWFLLTIREVSFTLTWIQLFNRTSNLAMKKSSRKAPMFNVRSRKAWFDKFTNPKLTERILIRKSLIMSLRLTKNSLYGTWNFTKT